MVLTSGRTFFTSSRRTWRFPVIHTSMLYMLSMQQSDECRVLNSSHIAEHVANLISRQSRQHCHLSSTLILMNILPRCSAEASRDLLYLRGHAGREADRECSPSSKLASYDDCNAVMVVVKSCRTLVCSHRGLQCGCGCPMIGGAW